MSTAVRRLMIDKALLGKNEQLAAANRQLFRAKGILALNLVSAPGSGKTALLERTLTDLAEQLRIGVIVGDLATDNDGRRLQHARGGVVQITTGTVCHLDAGMIARAREQVDLEHLDILVIENVGNLVCPAGYDLGEALRVVLLSVTEGEDKPLKYPTLFRTADLVLLTKMDLATAAGFDREAALTNLRLAAPKAAVLEVSARSGQGMAAWYDFLRRAVEHGRA